MLAPAERLRQLAWRLAATTALGRRCARERSVRVSVMGSVQLVAALTLTIVCPMWLLLLGPLVLGVPHVAADFRFLVARPLRPGTSRRPFLVMAALPIVGLVVARIASLWGLGPWTDVEIGFGLAGMLGAVAVSSGSVALRTSVGAAVIVVGAVALDSPGLAALVLAHLHHVVALGVWLAVTRDEPHFRRYVALATAVVAVGALILAGAFDSWIFAAGGLDTDAFGVTLGAMADTLAPTAEPVWAVRIVLVYAFGQAVHYTLWLRLMPTAERFAPRAVAPSLRRAWRAWTSDLGRSGMALTAALTVAVPLLALSDPGGVRTQYLTLVGFHGWLELMAVAYLAANYAPCASTTPVLHTRRGG